MYISSKIWNPKQTNLFKITFSTNFVNGNMFVYNCKHCLVGWIKYIYLYYFKVQTLSPIVDCFRRRYVSAFLPILFFPTALTFTFQLLQFCPFPFFSVATNLTHTVGHTIVPVSSGVEIPIYHWVPVYSHWKLT